MLRKEGLKVNEITNALEVEFIGAVSERKKLEAMFSEASNANERSYCLGLLEGQEKAIRAIERLLKSAKK